MTQQNINFVYLDATHIPENILKVRFPNIIAKLKENNLNLEKDLIKVFPAAHYLNGGIKTDLKGNTDIEGLYACGETAATGAHGANRLASNSLIEGLVFGWEISKDIQKKLIKDNTLQQQKISKLIEKIISQDYIGNVKTKSKYTGGNYFNNKTSQKEIDKITSDFRHMMSNKVGILRDEESLNDAKDFIDGYLSLDMFCNVADKKAVELINMLTVGSLIVKAASLRKESRGTHQRNDFTQKDDKNWKKHIILKEKQVYFEPVK
jgi:L-aspartate oxidase